MTQQKLSSWLDRPVDVSSDHVLGPANAPLTLVEYGSYACPYCRAANERIAEVRDKLGDRLRYVFRHRPLPGSDLAWPAAILAERANERDRFWEAHIALMTRSQTLTDDDLVAVADEVGLADEDPSTAAEDTERARARVADDEHSAHASGVMMTPTFFINGRRYDGPWDESAFAEAILGTLGHRVRAAALDFASWGPSAGILLLISTVLAVLLSNSPLAHSFAALWEDYLGFELGGIRFGMSLRHWIDDGLLSIFFLVVGLEIKRELTVGRLSSLRSAALPIAGAIGGMIAPALLYTAVIPQGAWSQGWGIPMATDTAFAVALIAMMGRRVPIELRVFLTAAAIVDDIGAIIVVAIFYSGALDAGYLAAAAVATGALALLNRSRVYRLSPYMLLGVILWVCLLFGGLHATLAGVLLALFIPTRPPPNLPALMTQAHTIVAAEAAHESEVLRHGPSLPALQALDAIHDRIESPADRLLRRMGARSSYIVLPVFALANAGLSLSADIMSDEHLWLALAIMAGLVVGKPLGMICACGLAVLLGIADKPEAYSWRQLCGAGALAGIGFTMSLFIAGQAFAAPADFDTAKAAIFAASVIAALIGTALLWNAERDRNPAAVPQDA